MAEPTSDWHQVWGDEFSIDLDNWSDLGTWPGLVESVATSPISGYERVTYEIPVTAGSHWLFLRNRASE